MKPKYEKPTALSLGEAAKGSGQCNAGSGVEPVVGTFGCNSGGTAYNCKGGNSANSICLLGGGGFEE
jgi:hypothetical protein